MMEFRCKMTTTTSRIFYFACMVFTLFATTRGADKGESEGSLSAKELLKTISSEYHTPTLPPGFPSLSDIQTNLFNFKTSEGYDRVSAALVNPVAMYPHYVQLTKVGVNFTYNKNGPKNATWKVDVKGTWPVGSTLLPVTVSPGGEIRGEAKMVSLDDLISAFLNKKENIEIGIDTTAIVLREVKMVAHVSQAQRGMKAVFTGTLDIKGVKRPTTINITVIKNNFSKVQLYSVMHFRHVRPKSILSEILHPKILSTPFFNHMLSSGDLFAKKKNIIGLAFSFNEVYHYRERSMAGHIIRTVLQSHIPAGITLLSHIKIKSDKKRKEKEKRSKIRSKFFVKVAFVINQPAFDLLLSQDDRILVSELLPALSEELSSNDRMQRFNRSLKDAYTTHVSFDSLSTVFSIFVRLRETIELLSPSMRINVTNLALQKNIGLDDKKVGWKVSAKGIYSIGGQRVRVKYSELTDEPGESFGLTGTAHELALDSILKEFSPTFYPSDEVRTMVENTEVGSLKLYKVRIYSRGSDTTSTPHLLITGLANLPQWEKEIQVALLLLYKNGSWVCKWAASLKNSPLSNILQALTGFDTRNLKILHNNHIITTIISSPLPPYSMLPSYIITTRLLRLPVQKALTVVALLPFPDNCGDDKMCESATGLLDTSKVYTVSGVLSMSEYILRARLPHTVNISDTIIGENNTLQFSISNNSKMEITTSFKLPKTDYVFDGTLFVDQNGLIEIDASSRAKEWVSPFGLKSITLEKMKLNTVYRKKKRLMKLNMFGKVKLGLQSLQGRKRTTKIGHQFYGKQITSDIAFTYDIHNPHKSKFFANFSDITIAKLLGAYFIDVPLPNILYNTFFPRGLVVSHGGDVPFQSIDSPIKLEGYINIFGRLLNCTVMVIDQPRSINIVTENSPAPLLFAKGEIIIQKDAQSSLQGPKIVATVDTHEGNVSIRGYVKVLGIESEVDISIVDNVKFTISGKLMDYKETTLTASSTDSLEQFQVYGCLKDVAFQVQILLLEIITKSANQSVVNKRKAESNYLNAQNYNEVSDHEEMILRTRRDHDRARYEEHLLDYGRFEVKVNDTCLVPACEMKCFGCPRLEKCCRLDIFGHCIACSSWKACCWKNVNPLCISKQDGCDVIRTAAQRSLAEKEDQILQERIELDNLELHVLKAEVNKGKHEAVLEAAIDAKQLVEEDSSPGLNAHDAIKNFGPTHTWAKINSVCYNTSIEQAATGCMKFIISAQLFKMEEQNLTIWSCLKDDLVTELAESLANLIFPNIVDTSDDSITEVAEKLNGAKIEHHLNQLTASSHHPPGTIIPGNNPVHPQMDPHPQQHNHNTQSTHGSHILIDPQDSIVTTKISPLATDQSGLPDKAPIAQVDFPSRPSKHPPPPPILLDGVKTGSQLKHPGVGVDEEKTKDVFHADAAPAPIPKQSHSPPAHNIKITAAQKVSGFAPASGDHEGSAANEDENELKGIYESGASAKQTAAGEDTTPEQTETYTEASEMSPNEENEVADRIIEDEEKEEEKGVKDAVEAADRDMSKIVQNETDLMLRYQFNPKYRSNIKYNDPKYRSNIKYNEPKYVQHPPPSFFYQLRNQTNDNNADFEYDDVDPGMMDVDPGMMFRTDYPMDDALKQDREEFIYPSYQRERKKRHIADTPNEKKEEVPLKRSVNEGEEQVPSKRSVSEGDEEEDLMEEAKQLNAQLLDAQGNLQRIRRSPESTGSTGDLGSTRGVVENSKSTNDDELDRPVRETYTDKDFSSSEEDLMSVSKKQADATDAAKHAKHRSRRSVDDDADDADAEAEADAERARRSVSDDAAAAVVEQNGDELIEKRLKRDISALYDPEEYQDEQAEYLDLDEVFKQKLNEQHSHRDKRSRGDTYAPITNHVSETSKRMLFSKPFWDVRPDRRRLATQTGEVRGFHDNKNGAHRNDGRKGGMVKGGGGVNMMRGMLKKRWKIPENSNGRCHIYHQLIAICKDMADTIVTLDKSLNRSRAKFLAEDKDVYMELFDTEEYLVNAAKKINISQALTKEAEKTLTVVQQGVNIWSRRCTSEFDWQNKSGVQTWIQAMDLKIQELGGFGVYRFLENLFHAFQALFEVLTLGNTEAARDAIDLLHRTHSISKSFDRIFKDKLSVSHSRVFANEILAELEHLKKDSLFC